MRNETGERENIKNVTRAQFRNQMDEILIVCKDKSVVKMERGNVNSKSSTLNA